MNRMAEWKARLTAMGQSHVLDFWDLLSTEERFSLLAQLEQLDLPLLRQLYEAEGRVGPSDLTGPGQQLEQPPAIRLGAVPDRFRLSEAHREGESALRSGRVAALVVAGGQGTRLGFAEPKGLFPVGPISRRTLFQMHADRLGAIEAKYQTHVPWLIMTSPATDAVTKQYLRNHEYLGLAPERVMVFCQGTMPALDAQSGRILLQAPGQIALSPDGHGGTLAAMERAGLFAKLEALGIDTIFYFQVDNPLVAIGDPQFLGCHLLAQSAMTTQVVSKNDPLERLGNLVSANGHLRIIEYSDLPESLARRQAADGSLQFWAGSIAVHAFALPFLRRMASDARALPFHRALKKVPFVDETGTKVEPAQPNAVKFERFIFDILPQAGNALVVEVDRAEAFAPVKNAPGSGADSPETAESALMALHRRWLRGVGATVADEIRVEIHPSFALDELELRQRIPPGLPVTVDTYFH